MYNNQKKEVRIYIYFHRTTAAEPILQLGKIGYNDGWRDVCVGSPCTLFIGSGAESSWADAFKVAFAGTASLVLVAQWAFHARKRSALRRPW